MNIVILYLRLVLFGVIFHVTKCIEWDCASSTTTSIFTRSTDCTITGSNHVANNAYVCVFVERKPL